MILKGFASTLLTLSTLLYSLPVVALSVAPLEVHDIRAEDNSRYILTGPDSYFRFSAINNEERPRYLILNFKLESESDYEFVKMELFFKARAADENHFDPFYRVRFNVDTAILSSQASAIAIAIPNTPTTGSRPMRLDIDSCKQCRFQLVSYPKLTSNLPANIKLIQPYNVINGLQEIPEEGQQLATENWLLKDLAHSASGVAIDGNDPFMISPLLDASTSEFGGILFDLTSTDISVKSYNFQLFYATEFHGFTEQASTRVRAKSKETGSVKFVVPLEFLGKEHPKSVFLQRLRLDFPEDQSEAHWRLNNVTLLHRSQMEQYRTLVPKRRLEVKRQRATGFGLIRKVILRVFSDTTFILSYLILLLLTASGFWRYYRK